MHDDKAGSNGHKLKQRRFWSGIRIKKSYHEGDPTLEKVAQKGRKISVLVGLQDSTGHGPKQPGVVALAVGCGLAYMTFERSFQTESFY